MKKSTKVILVVAAALMLVGIVVMRVGFMVGGNTWQGVSSERYTEKNFDASVEDLKSINIDVNNSMIDIQPSKDGKIHVNYFEDEKEKYNISVSEQGELTVTYESYKKWYDYIMINFFNNAKVTVSVPESLSGDIYVNTDNGYIKLKGLSVGGEIIFTGDNGEMVVEDTKVSKKLNAKTANGRLQLERVNCNGDVVLNSKNGNVEISNLKAKESIYAETSNGWMNIMNMSADAITLSTSNGSIDFESVDAGSMISFISRNGAIEGSILGSPSDYSIETETKNGTVDVPQGSATAQKQLVAKTKNGDIEIEFLS